jgi:protoporphyrinogen oxidase
MAAERMTRIPGNAPPHRQGILSPKEPSSGTVIAGAGPAGLACALGLARGGRSATVFEKDSRSGGLCRTIDFDGYLFDIGGHRFLSKVAEVEALWQEILGDDLLRVKRLSRIFYRGRFFNYPLSFFNTFLNLGPVESARCIASYLMDRVSRPADDGTFEGWIINRFGRRLYRIFFDVYTQKVWAMPCKDLSADWARQRIQGLSLKVAVRKAILRTWTSGPKTLTEEFLYPRRGPGEFFDRLRDEAAEQGARFEFNAAVSAVDHDGRRIKAVELRRERPPGREIVPVAHFVSSLPLPQLVKALRPLAPEPVLAAAGKLRFRSYLVVNIILNKKSLFPDQWIYVHSPEVRLGRIQNYKNWSPDMTPDPDKTSLGLEYFCDEGDALWRKNDVELVDFALEELSRIGIGSRKDLITGFVVRRPDAYPVYVMDYREPLRVVRDYLAGFDNLQTIGRAGLFRYCNSDLALRMGLRAADRILGRRTENLWDLGRAQDFLEG